MRNPFEELPIYVRTSCRFKSAKFADLHPGWFVAIRLTAQENNGFRRKLLRLSYIYYPISPHHTYTSPTLHPLTTLFLSSSPKVLTPPVLIPYNRFTFDLHGLIRRLGRLPLGSVLTRLISFSLH